MPSARQVLMLSALWALMAWLTAGAWAMKAQDLAPAASLVHYYSVRAPLMGALVGALWAPILCAGTLPGRPSAIAGRARGLAVERRTRALLRVVQGTVVGQLVGASATFLLLFFWPSDLQDTRMDAFKWAKAVWGLYWYLFVPAAAVAGALSVRIAVATGRPRRARVTPGD